MADLRSRFWIHAKGWLFLLIAGLSATLLLLESPRWRTAALLALCVWAACRWYYYAFYVVEKYVDGRYRFAGLCSFLAWWWRRRPKASPPAAAAESQMDATAPAADPSPPAGR